jgi:hypothetical protein
MTVENGDFVRVQATLSQGAATIMNSYLFRADLNESMDDATFMSQLVTAIEDLYALFHVDTSTATLSDSVTAYIVHYDTVEDKEVIDAVIGEAAWDQDGSGAGGALPSGVAALIRFGTGALKTRLKKYISGLCETAYENGAWDGAMITTLTDYAAQLLLGLTLSAAKKLVYGGFSKSAAGFTTANSAVINGEACYQRRRRAGVGI